MKPVMPVSLSLLFLVLLLAGCGSNTSTTASSTSTTSTLAAATATACAQTRSQRTLKTASGTLKSSSGSTLLIATQQGTSVTVTYSSATRFTRQSIVPASSLKEGTFVTVLVTSTNNSYAATRISITNGTGSGQFPGRGTGTGANNPCFSQARRSGTPGSGQFGGTNGNGNGAGTGTGNFRGLIGTVSQLNGNVLSVSDTSGANFTVTITPQTQIMETSNVTAAALKTGMALVVSGTAGSQGAINARTVSIVSKLPTRQPPQTPTPAQS
ncbi:MAG TPA: DUF5666 domain-containing protein [Ktedonobacteraceae bacterium]|nr:DUF5666 domain-containing protein [Ktedonobacteraceae bacterium]